MDDKIYNTKKRQLTCFKQYDIRGEIGIDLDLDAAYRIGRAVAHHFSAKSVVVGYDARLTSPGFADQIIKGISDTGSAVYTLGLSGTEEMYNAVSEFLACAGIMVTASHNPINYNGMKIVKRNSAPLNYDDDLLEIKTIAENLNWFDSKKRGPIIDVSEIARNKYVEKVVSFVDFTTFKPLKIVVDFGNGAAGPTFDKILGMIKTKEPPLKIIRLRHNPDGSFPNGIPNPLLFENRVSISEAVIRNNADLGIAFDGDFDRCFFFDNEGEFVKGEHVIGLIANFFLKKGKKEKIVHDPRIIWDITEVVSNSDGMPVQSRSGHSFVKAKMRATNAVYGGELSGHHYFRDFFYCDSGMIPWLIMIQLISKSKMDLSEWVADRNKKYLSSDELNFAVSDREKTLAKLEQKFHLDASVEKVDGLTFEYTDWRFNVRQSNTENLIRLNVEVKVDSNKNLRELIAKITAELD